MNLSEAFKQLDCLNEDVFEVSDKGIEELKDFIDSDDSDDTIEVIDPEAENKEEIKDSYVGKIICQCNVCKSLVYFDKDNIQIDEENGTVNADEECPFCFTNSGYSIVGEVAPYSDYQVEATDEDGNKVDVEVEVDGKKVSNESKPIKESVDSSVTDYKVFSLRMDVAVPGDKSLRDFGVGSTDTHNSLYNALSKALESVGLEMAGDYIDSEGDVTDVYKYNDYEFFNESKSIKESTNLSVTDYKGILKFVTKGVQTDGKISRALGTGDLEVNITPDDDSINKVISAAESIGFNEVDRFIDDSPMQGDSWVVLTKQSEEGRCVLAVVFNADHEYAFVNAGYDEDEDYEYFNESKSIKESIRIKRGKKQVKRFNEGTGASDFYYFVHVTDELDDFDELYDAMDNAGIGNDWDGDADSGFAFQSAQEARNAVEQLKSIGYNAEYHYDPHEDDYDDMDESCVNESLENVKLDTGDQEIEITARDNEPTLGKDEMIAPLDDNTEAEITSNDDEDSETEEKDEKLSLGKRKNESVRGNKMRKNCSESLDSIKLDDGNQKIEIKTKEKEDLPKDSMMVPPSDDTLEDILSDEESEVEEPVEDEEIDEEPMPEDGDIVDVDVDEVEDESFNRLGESFLKKVYENVKSFRTTSAATNGNTLVLEGLITFKSGKSKPTTFKFEANKINSKGKIRFLGENKDISSGRKSFALNCKVSKKAIIPESMTYNYVARGLNESQRVTGTVRLNESTRIRRR